MWHWGQGRHTDQWIRRESPETNPHIYDLFLFDKKYQGNSIGKKTAVSTNGAEVTGHPHGKKGPSTLISHITQKLTKNGT